MAELFKVAYDLDTLTLCLCPFLQMCVELSAEERNRCRATLHEVEGFALVMLCACMQCHVRKQAVTILKEVRNLFTALKISTPTKKNGCSVPVGAVGGVGAAGAGMLGDPCVLDVMDLSCPSVVEKVLPHLPPADRVSNKMYCQWQTISTF